MSWDINQVNMIGRLVKDPELRYSSQGNAFCRFGIAVGRKSFSKENSEEVYYFNVVVFGRMAEICGEYLLKGKQVAISGYLRQQRWEKNGEKFSAIEIIGDRVQFLGSSDMKKNPEGKKKSEKFEGKNLKSSYADDISNDDNVNNYEDEIPF